MAIPARASWNGTGPVIAGILAAVAAGAVAALLAGLSGAVPPLVAVAAAAVPAAAVNAGRLILLALTVHAATHRYDPCRGAGFLGLAVSAAGVTAAALPGTPPAGRSTVAAAGLALTIGLFVLGLMLLPGAASGVGERLRRGLDGLSIGVTLSFTFWLITPPDAVPALALAEALGAAGAVAVVTVIAVRAAAYRTAALLCGGGAATTLLGVGGLAVPLTSGYDGAGLLPAGLAMLAGPFLTWAGARRAGSGPTPAAPGGTAGYPLVTLPVGAALVTALYHLLTHGEFDRTAIALGLSAAALLAVREALSAADVRRYARRLAGREAHFRSLVAGANDLILVLDDDLAVRWQSPAAARLFGLSDQDVLGRPVLSLLHPEDVDSAALLLGLVAQRHRQGDRPVLVPARLRDGFGRWRDTESTISDQRDVAEVGALVMHLRDVGERRHLQQELHRMSRTDQLTSLPNRRELTHTVQRRREMPGQGGAVLVIDLLGLGAVNDERGREVGDAVLVEVSRRLRATLGPDDLPARLGGDEFGVVTPAGPVRAYALATRLLAELTRPYQLPGAVVILHASIGLAEVRDAGAGDGGPDDVLQRADLARRRAQQLGRDRIEWYDSSLEEQLVRRMDMERELAGAIGRGELDLVFQPVVHLLDRRPAGVEALLRWRHPTLGTVLPAEVLPVAEELGLADAVADWVLAVACRHLAAWLDAGNELWLSVNVSPSQLASPDLIERVRAVLAEHRLPPERLVVEVAEGRLGNDLPGVVTQLAALRALGVRTALDDFGAGHDSLSQLRRLPLDVLKIDGTLVSEPGRRQGPTRPLVDVVVSLGRRLGLDLVAEGLETRSRLDEALNAGCRLGQGFLLGRPMPAEHFEAYLEDHRTPSF